MVEKKYYLVQQMPIYNRKPLKMQLDVEGSPPANDSQASNLQPAGTDLQTYNLNFVLQSSRIYECQSNSVTSQHNPGDNPPSHCKHLLLVMNIKPVIM